jgi:tetratricopeptide (TPR) repeat protein
MRQSSSAFRSIIFGLCVCTLLGGCAGVPEPIFDLAAASEIEQGKKRQLAGDTNSANLHFARAEFYKDRSLVNFFRSRLADYEINAAKDCLTSHRYEDAITHLDRAELWIGVGFSSYEMRALAFRKVKNYDKAIEQLTKAMELFPDDPYLIAARADTYGAIKRDAEALSDYTSAIHLAYNLPEHSSINNKPVLLHVLNERAALFGRLGKSRLALRDKNEVKRLERYASESRYKSWDEL